MAHVPEAHKLENPIVLTFPLSFNLLPYHYPKSETHFIVSSLQVWGILMRNFMVSLCYVQIMQVKSPPLPGLEINTSPRIVVSAAGLLAAGVWVVRWASEKMK